MNTSHDQIAEKLKHHEAKTRVLLVIEHTPVRVGIRALIEMFDGFELVGEAGGGEDALRAIERLRPDVVLLDLTTLGMNSFDLLKEIRTRFSDIRVIVSTMHGTREYVNQALQSGAAGFIPKSAAATELKDAIETVMRGEIYVAKQTATDADLSASSGEKDQELLQRLTPRQREILICIAEGQSTKQIARALDISTKTVESHRSQLSERLDIRDVAGLVRFAIRTGLIRIGFVVCNALISGFAAAINSLSLC